MKRRCSKAPGKVILFGEHFVVKGRPALGMGVTLYARVCVERGAGEIYSSSLGFIPRDSRHRALFEAAMKAMRERFDGIPPLNIEIQSEIPIASGMGSSAAVAVALVESTLSYLDIPHTKEDVRAIAHEAEKAVHYKPSGVDTTLATYGGFLLYKEGVFQRVELKLPEDVVLVVVNTGVQRSTGLVVKEVLERCSRLGRVGEHIYSAAEDLVYMAIDALKSQDAVKLGELMLVNHGLLWAMGASSEACDRAVYTLLSLGAYGAKISGAGRGGIVIGLLPRQRVESAVESLKQLEYEFYVVEPDYDGVREDK
jgi:mevalonate kinase